ncbi:YybS family protein [Jeotgalibacillus haloalkalitolerans]|uniref:YybS family protein n=1 Tax=Jeotgalibacillus haloalkalitolerans TaxID=3104292 RepID=A0ABU5KIL2_9BACL|nr:YybS family protein [Jeotgalibacillus sp. HH7-29]MDZ5710611.1 YybS family protein [Jeotgalibacillus sp. HH7-29]
MNNTNTLKLTEGAMMTAFFAVLLLITVYVPFISIASAFFLLLPFLLYSVKYSIRASLVMLAASIGVAAIVGGPISIPVAILYGTTGVMMGWLVQQGKSKFMIFMISTLVFVVNIVVQYLFSILLLGINMIDEFITLMDDSLEQAIAVYTAAGIDTGDVQEQFAQIMLAFETLLPSLIIMSSALLIWIMMIINFPLVKRIAKKDMPKFDAFRNLSLPKNVIWYYLIILLTALIATPEQGTMFAYALINLQFGFELLMILQGLAFIHFYGHLKGWNRGLLVILTILGVLINPLTRILGIIDLGFDLRKRITEKK